MTSHTFHSIGVAHSPFTERFGIPRQAGLVTAARGSIELFAEPDSGICDGLTAFSHIWLIFVFDQNPADQWKPKVRPPRLGGNDKVGVFASRSPYRPNPVGMSVVKLLGQHVHAGRLFLDVEGLDIADGTAILDIKPYIPYADRINSCRADWAEETPAPLLEAVFSAQARQQLEQYQSRHPDLQLLISQVISHDPRPAYQKNDPERVYGLCLYELDIHWKVDNKQARVINISPQNLDK